MGDELEVVIANTYSIAELPPSDTQLILNERAKLLGLKMLVQDLGRVGMCIEIHEAAAGFGLRHNEQIGYHGVQV